MRNSLIASIACAAAILVSPLDAAAFGINPSQPVSAQGNMRVDVAHRQDGRSHRGDRHTRHRDWRRPRHRDWRRPRDCHRDPRRHPGVRGTHRHVGRDCRIVRMRPRFNRPPSDQFCISVAGVRFCDDFH